MLSPLQVMLSLGVVPVDSVTVIEGEGKELMVTVLDAVATPHGPVGSLVVKVRVTVPAAVGVNVTAEGVAVCDVLLRLPVPVPPVIDHAPILVLPPTPHHINQEIGERRPP